MFRRDLLRYGAGAALTVATATTAAGHEAQDGDGYAPLGSVDLPGTRDAAVSDDGEIAYVAIADGIATVDLSDPEDPTILAEERNVLADHDEGPMQALRDVWPDGDRLLAVGPAKEILGHELRAALLYDVSDPADPELLDVHETDWAIHNSFYDDGIAYLTGNFAEEDGDVFRNQMVMVSTEGDEFGEVGRWSIGEHEPAWDEVHPALRQLHDLYVQDGTAYLAQWDAGTWIVDVSDPAEPEYLADFGEFAPEDLEDLQTSTSINEELLALPGNSHYVQVDETGNLLGVGREAWTVETEDGPRGGPGGIDLYDVSDPDSIEHLSSIEAPETHDASQDGEFTTSHNFDVVDGRLYSSWYYGGVKIHDVSDPADPEELAWWREPSEAMFWTAQSAVPGEYFVGSSSEEVLGYGYGFPGRLYVFPDETGQQADPPDLTVSPEQRGDDVGDDEDDGTGGDGDDADDGLDDDGEGGMDDDGNDGLADDADDGMGDEADDGDEADELPGFGIVATTAALGLAGWRLLASDDDGKRA